jgi:hypothetical protein
LLPQEDEPHDKSSDDIAQQALMRFLFPEELEQPQSTGRLELYARYGPVDAEGRLLGGIQGGHVHTKNEIRQMINHNTREALFSLFKRERSTVAIIVDELLPIAMAHNYTRPEVNRMLRKLPDRSFGTLQSLILENQKKRLKVLVDDPAAALRGRGPKIPFQSMPGHILHTVMRQAKHNECEEALFKQKRLHAYGGLVAEMGDQNKGTCVLANVRICRDHGPVDERWDRYSAIRGKGKASYVQARNSEKAPCHDDGAAEQHRGCASLLAASMHSLKRH